MENNFTILQFSSLVLLGQSPYALQVPLAPCSVAASCPDLVETSQSLTSRPSLLNIFSREASRHRPLFPWGPGQ